MLTLMVSTMHTQDLRAYLSTLPRGGVANLARAVGIHPVYLSQLAARQDNRVPSPELCVLLELATGGAVTRRDLRPDDWHRIWPELVTDQHPAPAAVAAQGA
jgi:DNA-binding transcriptional regulator YdaS (Cro superfamily)